MPSGNLDAMKVGTKIKVLMSRFSQTVILDWNGRSRFQSNLAPRQCSQSRKKVYSDNCFSPPDATTNPRFSLRMGLSAVKLDGERVVNLHSDTISSRLRSAQSTRCSSKFPSNHVALISRATSLGPDPVYCFRMLTSSQARRA